LSRSSATLDTTFTCGPHGCEGLSIRCCLSRQQTAAAIANKGRNWRACKGQRYESPEYYNCLSCPQGKVFAQQFPDFKRAKRSRREQAAISGKEGGRKSAGKRRYANPYSFHFEAGAKHA
jgi:hypothetical protein